MNWRKIRKGRVHECKSDLGHTSYANGVIGRNVSDENYGMRQGSVSEQIRLLFGAVINYGDVGTKPQRTIDRKEIKSCDWTPFVWKSFLKFLRIKVNNPFLFSAQVVGGADAVIDKNRNVAGRNAVLKFLTNECHGGLNYE